LCWIYVEFVMWSNSKLYWNGGWCLYWLHSINKTWFKSFSNYERITFVKIWLDREELKMCQTLTHMFWTHCKKCFYKMNNNLKLDIEELGMYQKIANMYVWDICETHCRKPSYKTNIIKCAFNSQELYCLDINNICSLFCTSIHRLISNNMCYIVFTWF
jgi:hypothetical protein